MKTKIFASIVIISIVILNSSQLFAVTKDEKYIKAELARIKKAGEPVTVSDLGEINIPKNQNAAYIYLEAVKYLPKSTSSADKNDWTNINSLDKALNSNPKVIENARAQVKAAEKSLKLLEKAISLPRCRFPRDYSNSIKVTYPEFAHIRELARLSSAKAMIAINDNNLNEALKHSIISFRVSKSCADEPATFAQLVRYAVLAIGCKSIQRVNQEIKYNNNQLQSIYNELNNINIDDGVKIAYKGERAMGYWCFEHPDKLDDSINFTSRDKRIAKNLLIMDKAFYLMRMKEVIDFSDIPYSKRVSMGIGKKLEDIPQSPNYILSNILLPPFSGLIEKNRDKTKTTIYATKIMLLLKMYHNNYAEYPSSLSQLSEKLGKKIENDSFSGKPFKYKKDGNGFILYSIGENLKDDGGVSKEDLKAKGQSSDNVDLVWKM